MAGNTAILQIKIDVDNKGTVTLDQVSKSLNNVDVAARKASEGLGTVDKGMAGVSSSATKAAADVAPLKAKLQESKLTADEFGKASKGLFEQIKVTSSRAYTAAQEAKKAQEDAKRETAAAALAEQGFGKAAEARARSLAATEAARAQQAKQAAEAARQAEAAAAAAAKTTASFGQLGLRSVQQIRAELLANKAAYDQIRTSGTASAQDISRAYTALSAKNKELNAELKQTQQATGGLSDMIGGKLLPAIAGIATLGTAGKVIGMADEMSVLSSKVKLATGSVEEHRAVQQQLYAMSQATRSEIGVNASAFFGYSTALNSTGATSKDVLGVIDMVNKSLKVSGATAGEASSFVLQFKQALGSGVLQGDEFRSMTENNVVFARALAEALDTDVTGLRAMSSAGELTTRKLATLFPEMAANISAAFDKIPVTVEGATTQIENAFKMALAGANETTDGTNKLATQISGLAVIVQENAPAIGALFNGVTLGAQGFVRLGSFVVGTFETIAAAALAASGVIFKVGEGVGWLTDQIGITEQAAQRWRAESDAAFGAAGGLAGQAADNYNRMTRSTAEAEKAQKDYLKSLQGSSAAVLADIDAQKKREAEHAGSVQSMSKAEKKAADERAKVLDEMHKSIGGEDYYRREADKVLAHVEVLKKAGATQEQQAQYTYEKIAELSAQAWKKGETAAGEYLDQLKGTMADSVNLETAAQAKREAAQASSLDKMANAEKKAADDRAKIIDEMYKGIGGEAFYQHEAENVLAHVEVLRQAGATQQEQAQYTYGKLAELSEQAWQKGETAAGKYLDTLRATMASATGVTAEASKAQSDAIIKAFEKTGAGAQQYYDVQRQRLTEERDQVIALTGDSLKANQWYAAELEKLKAKTSSPVTVKVDADPSTFDQKAAASRQQSAELAATVATVKVDADTSQFDSAIASAQQSAQSVGGQMAVNMQSAEELKAAIQALDATPTLDPFGETRKQYRKALDDMDAQATAAANQRAATEAAAARKAHEEQLASAQEMYKQQVDAAEKAYDEQRKAAEEAAKAELEARKESLNQQIVEVEAAQKREQEVRSAYAEIYKNTGLGAEQALAGQAEELYEQAQQYKQKGVDVSLIEAQLQVQLEKLRKEAAEAGVTGLNQYIATLENSYRSTGEFSASTVKAAQEVEALRAQIAELESVNIEAWFSGGTNSAAGLSGEIKRLEGYLNQLTSKEYTVKLGMEKREEAARRVATGKIATPRGYEETYAGGGYTWDGPRSGGMDGIGGRQVLLHPQETVIDHLKPDRAAIVSLYDQFVGSQQRGAAASSASPAAAAAAGEAPINIGTLIIHQATDVDGIMREIRRRAVR